MKKTYIYEVKATYKEYGISGANHKVVTHEELTNEEVIKKVACRISFASMCKDEISRKEKLKETYEMFDFEVVSKRVK